MTAPSAPQPEFEPFGQRGARSLLRPAFITFCSIGLAISLAMLIRSQSTYDMLWKTSDGQRIEIASAMGRFMVTSRPFGRRFPNSDTWTYETSEFSGMQDGWQPSLLKTIGIQWGYEAGFTPRGNPMTYWRLRIRWRTLALLYLAPLVIESLVKRRRTLRAQQDAGFIAE